MTVAAAYVQLPSDASNTGKKQRTQSRTVGADTVHEPYMVMSSSRDYQGVYGGHSGNLTFLAAAQNGTSTGFLWTINPSGSTVTCALARLRYASSLVSALALATVPRVISQLFTFTGTASGAALTVGKFNSGYPAAQGSVRTAMTGMTITLGAIIDGHLPPMTAGTTAWTVSEPNVDDNIANSELSDINLKTAEGIVQYQADAGTTADTRKLIIDMAWSEYN